jgi:hypothetical protein
MNGGKQNGFPPEQPKSGNSVQLALVLLPFNN